MQPKTAIIRSSRDLGQLIAATRRRRGLSQRQVADALGATQAWISRVEQGQQRAGIGQVLRLMSHLGITLTGAISDSAVKASAKRMAGKAHPDINRVVD